MIESGSSRLVLALSIIEIYSLIELFELPKLVFSNAAAKTLNLFSITLGISPPIAFGQKYFNCLSAAE